ncbi:pleckstrin homology domain-containing family d member 1 [Plakobranchus ocellatus]|uniref:Pleckstrin homology domain-containing family d member 1 n=1 Tax=Plakobranchus ocellatus TaxID=259542 RepID=A0AAV4DMX8_9GAST|nr:pleckstrin homology domain-containing family d member 1 [Plakobranchus ocellatus]
MPELGRSSSVQRDWATRIQIHGVLMKRPFGHQSTKWAKRFFLVKDGFLMYYDANEKKDYEKREFFNIHPKGVLPLGECCFKPCREPQQPFCVIIESPEIDDSLTLVYFGITIECERDENRPEQGDLRLSGPPSGQGAGSGARTRDRRVPADFRADSQATVLPTPPF